MRHRASKKRAKKKRGVGEKYAALSSVPLPASTVGDVLPPAGQQQVLSAPAPRSGGRPTKYEGPVTLVRLNEFVDDMETEAGVGLFFVRYCSVPHVARHLGVCRDTILEWSKQHPEFSEVMKRWSTTRDSIFIPMLTNRRVPPAIWIFLAKNWLGMTDRHITELQAGSVTKDGDGIPDSELERIAAGASLN